MQHSVLLFISRGEDISLPLLEFHKFNYGAVFDSVLFPFSSGGLVLQGTVRHEFVSTPALISDSCCQPKWSANKTDQNGSHK